MRMEGECEVICRECNGYLWSEAACDNGERESVLIACPYKKDPLGKCTGQRKKEVG